MNRFARSRKLAQISALIVPLAACSGHADSSRERARPAPTAAQSPWLAIARGRVDVEGGLVHIVATRNGVVTAVKVHEGDNVKKGEVLAELDPRAAQIDVAVAKAEVEKARAQAAELRAKLHRARQRAPLIAAAAKAGAATGEAADEAQDTAAVLNAQSDAAKAAVDAARQHLAAARYEVDARAVRAPIAGRIVHRNVQVGQGVPAQGGTALFDLLPDRPHIVRAELDASDADAISPGMRAQVVRDTGDGPTYGATVLRVGEVLGPGTLSDDPLQRATEREVECVLRLESKSGSETGANPPGLRIGSRVLVRFPR
ncbi:MAG: HlyD family efflux transporter periplasmic adaptor subunit [Rhodanobacteraceae bacterium]